MCKKSREIDNCLNRIKIITTLFIIILIILMCLINNKHNKTDLLVISLLLKVVGCNYKKKKIFYFKIKLKFKNITDLQIINFNNLNNNKICKINKSYN